MPTTDWSDLNRDGRRLERIIKQMDTKMKNTRDIDIYVNLANTLIRATKQKTEIARIILNVEDVLKKAEKQYAV